MSHGQRSLDVLSPATSRLSGDGDGSLSSSVNEEIAALRAIVEGTARSTGEEFFQSLVRHLARAVDTAYAFVAEFAGAPTRARTLAYIAKGEIQKNIEWNLAGTPCEDVVHGNLCHHPTGVSQKFPDDIPMVQMGIESYLGVPLVDAAGKTLGHLAVFDDRPMPEEPRKLFIFRIFAARAAVELERLRAEKLLRESESRYRDLYEHAPIAYVATDRDGNLTRVNERTCELLQWPAAQLIGRPLLELFADSEAGRRHAVECLRRSQEGHELRGVELELRRQDGSPLWISLWQQPPRSVDGKLVTSRSMWVDVTDRVIAERQRAQLQLHNQYLREEIQSVHNFEEIIGQSAAIRAVLANVRRVAPTDASVLIRGETGTGKELIARAIHTQSSRRDKPLIKVNCAALPSGLFESELFGHEKGAFTGAITRRIGRFELANGGTIFLDEIGELPLDVQAKLLRVLQEREFDRVGGTSPIQVDVRVIAATNRDLRKSVDEKTFREDLFYRLNVFPITLPPLRERTGDIPLLVHFLVSKFTARIGKTVETVSAESLRRLAAYPWPGNVRELENILERAVILSDGAVLEVDPETVPMPPLTAVSSGPLASLETVERMHIEAVLEKTDWVIEGPSGAAGILGLHPNTLRSRLKKLGISRTTG